MNWKRKVEDLVTLMQTGHLVYGRGRGVLHMSLLPLTEASGGFHAIVTAAPHIYPYTRWFDKFVAVKWGEHVLYAGIVFER